MSVYVSYVAFSSTHVDSMQIDADVRIALSTHTSEARTGPVLVSHQRSACAMAMAGKLSRTTFASLRPSASDVCSHGMEPAAGAQGG